MPTLERVAEVLERAPHRIAPPEGARRAAVAAILTPDLELLFMLRARYAGDPWSGHISFPGGRVEAGEGVLDAAIRETLEEIGLRLSAEHLLGELDEVRTQGPLPPLVIRPYVFAVPDVGRLRPNGEVASIHRRSLAALLSDEGRGTMTHPWREHRLTLPRVDFDGVRLWGLTLHMVDDLLHRLDGRGRGMDRIPGAQGATPWEDPRQGSSS